MWSAEPVPRFSGVVVTIKFTVFWDVNKSRCRGKCGMWHAWKEVKTQTDFVLGRLRERSAWKNLVVEGMIMLKRIAHKYDGLLWCGVNSSGSGCEVVAGCSEHRNES